MKVGIPRGLLYFKYKEFAHTFLEEMGTEIVLSPETNKNILDEGVRHCVDDACLPVKIIHGHVKWLRNRCDAIFLPRIIGIKKKEFICPMFCGLNEMLCHSISDLPKMLDAPIRAADRKSLLQWAIRTGRNMEGPATRAVRALDAALHCFKHSAKGMNHEGYTLKVCLLGHPYNIYDRFINMDLTAKLNALGIGVMTSDNVDNLFIDAEVRRLYKKPFWTYAQEYYGCAASLCASCEVNGMIYLSSFSCGIDSVVIELIRSRIGDFPFMVLKLDEHTGEAGYITRIEAFKDMLERRERFGHNVS